MNVEVIFEKSFSDVEQEIIDRFVEFQNALIEADVDLLNEILLDDFESVQIPSQSQSKQEFVFDVNDGYLVFSKIDILELEIIFDDDNVASLMGKIRLTAEVKGRELRWISNTVAGLEKIDGNWYLRKWEY